MESLPVTVVEMPDFIAAARKLMRDDERMSLLDYLARNPLDGALIPGSGGMRKVRWALEGRGKRGGARIIYYFHGVQVPLFVLDVYAKNERAEVSAKDVKRLKQVVKLIVSEFVKVSDKP